MYVVDCRKEERNAQGACYVYCILIIYRYYDMVLNMIDDD